MLQSVPVISPFRCLVMWWLGILSDICRLSPHHRIDSIPCSSSLHCSCFILLPPLLGWPNNQCSNNMSRGKERKKGRRARSGWRMVDTGFLEPESWAFFFFFPRRAWHSYRSCGWIRRKLVPVGEVVTNGIQVINWDKNRRWKENKEGRVQTAVTDGRGAGLVLPGESQAWNVPRKKGSGKHGKEGLEVVRDKFKRVWQTGLHCHFLWCVFFQLLNVFWMAVTWSSTTYKEGTTRQEVSYQKCKCL